MSSPDTTRCSRCGATKPAHAPCPHCLLQLGFSAGGRSSAGAARTQPAPPTPEELADRFPGLEIQEAIGQGGMGVVYRARQKKLDRLVALKILSPGLEREDAFAERFLREARAMARLDHEHIVAVYDFGETDGMCWLLMEYVDGVNLRAAMSTGDLTPERALAIVPQLCDALQTAHDLGIVHRDIKPENVLLDRAGRVKIADFGLAKLADGEADHGLTRSDVGMGTLHYMAPEQLRGARDVDHRADIYSLGVVFYEMLTGQLPLGRFEPPSAKLAIDVRLDEVVLRALEAEPAKRYQSAVQVKTDVQSIERDPARPSEPPAAGGGKRWRTWGVGFPCMCIPLLHLWLGDIRSTVGLAAWLALAVFLLFVLTRSAPFASRELLQSIRSRSLAERGWRVLAFTVCALAGLTVFGLALESTWELGTRHYVASTSSARGLAEPWSEEYGDKLLRMLPEYAAAEAAVPELGTPQRDRWLRHQLPNPAGTFLIAGIGLWMAGIALCWRRNGTDWYPIATPLLGTLVFTAYAMMIAELRQTGHPRSLHGIGGSLVLERDIASVREGLLAKFAARSEDVVVQIGESLVEKRTREKLARHELIAVRPASPLGRWRCDSDGPQRLAPGLVVELVAKPGSRQTSVSWDAGMLLDGDPHDPQWRADIEALFASP